jgi:glycine betaine/proline transport system permease protein
MSSTVTATKIGGFDTGLLGSIRRHAQAWALVAVVVLWVVVWAITQGTDTLQISAATHTNVHDWLQARADAIIAADDNWFLNILNNIADAINSLITWLQQIFTVGKFPRPVPEIGWFGTLAIAMWVTYAVAGGRMVPLVTVSFLLFGALGFWEDSIDTLIVTFVAVAFSVAIGIPIGVWMARSKTASSIITPILDLMQTMPSFVYLLPFVIFFGIGAACATLVTLVYALPPVTRITAYAITNVSPTTLEATSSLGQTTWQRLKNVELPMAKRTIIVGFNQTMMAALSMVTIAAFVDSPGLGQPVVEGLIRGDLGGAFVSGICIVIMAIMLDRTTTAASVRAELAGRSGKQKKRQRRYIMAGGGVLTVVAIYLSNTRIDYNQWPSSWDIGTTISDAVDRFSDWLTTNVADLTTTIQDKFTVWFLNPMEDLLADSPWYVTFAAIVAIALIVGGLRAFAVTLVCLGGIYYLDLWNNAMITLTSVLVATAVVMVLALIIGVWIGRSKAADRAIRPLLDAGQTMPPFVYLVPILILFGSNRFTAIVAGVVYAAPAAIKLVADGIRGVSPTTIEAAESTGTNRWQMITKVQLPMARGSLLLAANQGLLYVLSMIVIGGMVGAGALGFDVVSGFRQADNIGRGLAAGISIVLLGIMLDRITTYGAANKGLAGWVKASASKPRAAPAPAAAPA